MLWIEVIVQMVKVEIIRDEKPPEKLNLTIVVSKHKFCTALQNSENQDDEYRIEKKNSIFGDSFFLSTNNVSLSCEIPSSICMAHSRKEKNHDKNVN